LRAKFTLATGILQWMFFLILGCLIYFNLLISQDAINPDAQFIMPLLESYQGPWDYLKALVALRTFDVQPIRDLSFWIDIKIYRSLGYNSFVLQNLLILILIVHQLANFIRRTFTALNPITIILIGAAFLTYPLFSQITSWGMARKHLLSVFFILVSTRSVLESPRTPYRIIIFYLLSILSHPISLLWPLWAMCFQWLSRDRLPRDWIPLYITCFFMLLFFGITYAYYDSSVIFKSVFGERTVEVFNIPDKILSLGHYSFQVFFPYLLGFRYFLGHWSSLIGLIFIGIFLCLLLALKTPRKDILHWGIFILLPIGMVIAKSNIFYDTYTLLPSIGVLILIIKALERVTTPKANLILLLLIVVWTFISYKNTEVWRDEVLLTRRAFENRPTCNSAYEYLKISYESAKQPENHQAKEFVLNHDCIPFAFSPDSILAVKSFMLYHDSKIPKEQKISHLIHYSKMAILPAFILAAEYIGQRSFTEADLQIEQLTNRWGTTSFREEYMPIVERVLHPYCQQKSNQKCIIFLKPFLKRRDPFYYK
jgi:hypothetical protein